jgi:putative beta-lysine N-acetyltransferase
MTDTLEHIHGSLVQHGHHNRRMYVMHLDVQRAGELIARLDRMAIDNNYGKIIVKAPATCWKYFRSAGYVREACVPSFFKGRTDGLFVAKFLSAERRRPTRTNPLREPSGRWSTSPGADSPHGRVVACTPTDAPQIGRLYRQVFETYPFPIHRPGYLKGMMANTSIYFGVRVDNRIAAVAAAEIDSVNRTCEMTDFATAPTHRGKGFAAQLLTRLDQTARARDLRTAYTIARADSVGMNRVFTKTGYRYAGRLVKNSQIGGRIRSMVVWYKHLGR